MTNGRDLSVNGRLLARRGVMFPWVTRRRHAVLFVVPGGTGGFPAVNLDLYRRHRAFRDSIECTGAIVEHLLGWTAAAAFRGEREPLTTPELARRNELVHHGMTRIALIDHWRADGIVPDGAIGVSLGEVVAPYAVCAISREDCARLVTVVSHSVTHTPSPCCVYVVDATDEHARRLCRAAPVPVDFLGASSPALSLLLSRQSDAAETRRYLGDAIVKEAPSGWPYHTPAMYWNREWSHAQLGPGVALGPVERPVYSPAVGGRLPADTRFDAQCVQWIMSVPSHFANAVSAALTDGFDTIVQVAATPMHVFADVLKTAEAEGRRVRQFHASDAKARATVRRMARRAITPRPWPSPVLRELPSTGTDGDPRDLETERVAERLLQPLAAGTPFDVVAAFADPIADVVAVDRGELRRALASSVLIMLSDDRLRQRVTEHPALLPVIAGDNRTAVAALRVLLRLAPDFAVFQPLNTVKLGGGDVLQLVIER